jgi:Prokaryotic N-terminal methylation motif
MYRSTSKNTAAFTLIELAIVLSITGLVIGGVFVGRDLIRSASLRKVPVAIEKLHTSMNTFKEKYSSLPGDFSRATTFWGTDPDGCPTHTVRTPRTQTCNGNGDNVISGSTSPTHFEYFRFWQHLSSAGLYDARFTGVAGDGGSNHLVGGENIPIIYDDVALGVYWHSSKSGHAWFMDGHYGNILTIGKTRSTTENVSAAFTPEEALNIDLKIDDGKPNTGKLMAMFYSLCSTAADNDSDDFAANYDLTQTDQVCAFFVHDIIH